MHLQPPRHTFTMILNVVRLSYPCFYKAKYNQTFILRKTYGLLPNVSLMIYSVDNDIHNTATDSSMLLPNKYRNYA